MIGRRRFLGSAVGFRCFPAILATCLVTQLPAPRAEAVDIAPKIVLSIASGSGTTICDTDCTTCTVVSGECIDTVEEQLLLCRPLANDIPITGCDWELFLDGPAPGIDLNSQLRAIDIAPNGNLLFVALNDDTFPVIGAITKKDIGIYVPDDVTIPYTGGGAYTDGDFHLYLDGDLTQQDETTKPWDAMDLLLQNGCEDDLRIDSGVQYTCPVVGSLTAGTGSAGLGGVHFRNEDLLRCTPSAFGAGGTVQGCTYSVFLDASNINADALGQNQGITTDIEAIDLLSFDAETMSGRMVFKKGSGAVTGFPVHDPKFDLLLYEGTFGAGLCDPSGNPCAGEEDCPSGESCDTGSCSLDSAPCATDQDCSGSGNVCNTTRYPVGTVTKLFDGVAVGLTGLSQTIEAFAIVPDRDGDDILDGLDTCTNPFGVQDLVVKPKLLLKKINTEVVAGNDGLLISGEFGLGDETDFSNLDPIANGARVLIHTVSGATAVDVSIPGGAFDGVMGWKVNGSGTKYKFTDKTKPPVHDGIGVIQIQDRSNKVPKRVKVKVKGKDGTYPVVSGDEPVEGTVVIGDAASGECTETAFLPADCKFNGKANVLKCQK